MNEAQLQEQVCRYLKTQYPEVIFTSESAGYYATIGQATKRKRTRSNKGLPDLLILEPRKVYHGLMIELKAEGKSPYKKDGTLRTDKHTQEQAEVLQALLDKGYLATFATGYEEAVRVLDNYLR